MERTSIGKRRQSWQGGGAVSSKKTNKVEMLLADSGIRLW
jgi:hypothetical protein